MENQVSEVLTRIKKLGHEPDELVLSLGEPKIKAKTFLLKKPKYFKEDILKQVLKFKSDTGHMPEWVRIDAITSREELQYEDLITEMTSIRRNYIPFGIRLDKTAMMTFLPEEINANAFMKPTGEGSNIELSENNVNAYLKRHKKAKRPFLHRNYVGKTVEKFHTQGFLIDGDEVVELVGEGMDRGLRKVKNLNKELDKLITTSTEFLASEIKDNGKFIYGYFSHFDREINFYNNLRHASSTYAMIEGLKYLNRSVTVARKPINYLIQNKLIKRNDETYFVYDDTNDMNEIKLGQNAAFILALTEYLTMEDAPTYLRVAQRLANGILDMIDFEKGETTHVLHYPSLNVKQRYRIIYYDGEAALALLRLYQIDGDEKWLDAVKKLFEIFIEKDYWKHHDHWLGYCTNELVKVAPEEKYIEFGLKNTSGHLDFIHNRETTFPTFLELLMSTYYLVNTAREHGFDEVVKENIDEEKLMNAIHRRADYERIGYFYPELAMFFKNPERILGSFFIKHHGFRVRIDDIEHYLSGLVHYQYVFKKK